MVFCGLGLGWLLRAFAACLVPRIPSSRELSASFVNLFCSFTYECGHCPAAGLGCQNGQAGFSHCAPNLHGLDTKEQSGSAKLAAGEAWKKVQLGRVHRGPQRHATTSRALLRVAGFCAGGARRTAGGTDCLALATDEASLLNVTDADALAMVFFT